MWNILKLFFKVNKESPQKNKEQEDISVKTDLKKTNHYVSHYHSDESRKIYTSFEKKLIKLRDFNGYNRQNTLKELQDCFSPELFIHLLFRVSDYVPENRHLAKIHFQKWSEKPEFAKLCIFYFLEILNLEKRERADFETLHLLIFTVMENLDEVETTIRNTQGQLPRELLKFAIQKQMIQKDKLLELCKSAKDSCIRMYWLENILSSKTNSELITELLENPHKDIQYKIFDSLYRKDCLETQHLVVMWNSHYIAVMDYAYFALRQKNFDFEYYFKHRRDVLSQKDIRTRCYQLILHKAAVQDLFQEIQGITSKSAVNRILLFAVKHQIITISDVLGYFEIHKIKLKASLFSKFKKYSKQLMTLSELEKYVGLLEGDVSIKQRLEFVDDLSEWIQLYWFVYQEDYVLTIEDQSYFKWHITNRLFHLGLCVYSPRWTQDERLLMNAKLPAFMKKYPEVFKDQNTKHNLQKYFEN